LAFRCCEIGRTDFTGIVYHASFLRFMERGRTEYMRRIGAGHRDLFEQAASEAPGFGFVVRSMRIDYRKSAHMDDVLHIVTIPEEVKGASITLLQQCRRGDDLLVEAHVRVAFISGGKAQRIPKSLRIAMEDDRSKQG
jgi:acyl-CoA thioester hydrolase